MLINLKPGKNALLKELNEGNILLNLLLASIIDLFVFDH